VTFDVNAILGFEDIDLGLGALGGLPAVGVFTETPAKLDLGLAIEPNALKIFSPFSVVYKDLPKAFLSFSAPNSLRE
jgi:hypothetical protein